MTMPTPQRVFAGLGAQGTPLPVLDLMQNVAATLAAVGWTLRTGGDAGAEEAFETGAKQSGEGRCELYLPWPGFRGRESPFEKPTEAALEVAKPLVPYWDSIGETARRIQARNVQCILGPDVRTPSLPAFLVCWTQDGASTEAESCRVGTGLAICLAARHGVPVFNLRRRDHLSLLADALTRALRQNLSSGDLHSA